MRNNAVWVLEELRMEWYRRYGKYMRANLYTGEEWLEIPEELEAEERELSMEIETLEIKVLEGVIA